MLKTKKAQISWVMVIGIAAVLIIGISLAVGAQKSRIAGITAGPFSEIKTPIDNCIRNALFYSSYFLTTKGGYINPSDTFETPFGNISYALKDSKKTFVGIDVLKTEISIISNALIHICALEAFEKFPQYKITAEKPFTEITFTRDSIDAVVDFKITAEQDQKQRVFEKFIGSVPVRLSYIHSEIEKMLDSAITEEGIDLTYLNSMDFDIRIVPYKDHKLFILQDKESRYHSIDFPFLFIIK